MEQTLYDAGVHCSHEWFKNQKKVGNVRTVGRESIRYVPIAFGKIAVLKMLVKTNYGFGHFLASYVLHFEYHSVNAFFAHFLIQ